MEWKRKEKKKGEGGQDMEWKDIYDCIVRQPPSGDLDKPRPPNT